MNKTLKLLIFSDIFVLSGFGLVAPIIAIFIDDNLVGGTILTAGIASAIFMITHALLQLVFSYYFNPKDRLWMLKLGTFLMVLVPIGYIFSTQFWHIYVVEFIYGIAAAFAYPSWSSLFTANLERGKRGFQYAIYSSGVSVGTAITAAAGAWVAEKTGFEMVFIFTGIMALIGMLILFKLDKKVLRKI